MYLEHVGTNSLHTTNEQLPYHQSHLSRLCELYYNRYLHTLRGFTHVHACAYAHTHTHIQPHMHPLLPNCHSLKSSCIKGSCLSSHFISVIFSSLTLFSPLSLHTFFSPFLLLIPLCFSLFVSYPVSFSPFASLSALPTCQRDSPPKRSDVFFLFYIHLPFLESSLFLKCRLKGSISQVLLCPPTCKNPAPPTPPHTRIHTSTRTQSIRQQQPASQTPASFLIN